MSTDIVDKDLKALRNGRWDKAFKKEHRSNNDNKRDAVNRKATIVIEHIIQASDISHTMQHWQVYRKWVSQVFCCTKSKDLSFDVDTSSFFLFIIVILTCI